MYYIVYGLLYLFSLLPWRIIYIISDGIAFVLYYIVRYRRKIVEGNLAIAFPEKPVAERKKVSREFYKNFVDNFIEVVKFLSISKEEMQKRFTVDAAAMLKIRATRQPVQFALGHFFNWEMANLSYSIHFNFPLAIVYMPIENKVLDRIFKKIRTRFGTNLVSATNFKNEFLPYTKEKYGLALVADQNPGGRDHGYWVDFFGRKTAFVKGPERNAFLNNEMVVLANFYKIKRGYYHSDIVVLTEDARSLPPGTITREIAAFVEASIRKRPSNYLWSHRRWKWEYDPAKYGHLAV